MAVSLINGIGVLLQSFIHHLSEFFSIELNTMGEMVGPDEHIENKIDFKYRYQLMFFGVIILQFELKLALLFVKVGLVLSSGLFYCLERIFFILILSFFVLLNKFIKVKPFILTLQ